MTSSTDNTESTHNTPQEQYLLREKALGMALGKHQGSSSFVAPEEVVETADLFYNYLNDGSVPTETDGELPTANPS